MKSLGWVCSAHLLLLSILMVGFFPVSSIAAEINITSDTIVRGYERDKTGQSDILVAPVYQFMQIDYGALSDVGLSFHGQGWGRSDLGDRDFFTDNETGTLLYGYVEYSTEAMALSTRLGRQYVFEGPSAESIDGLRVQGEYEPLSLSFSAFAGLPVALDATNGSSGDFVYGTALNYQWQGFNRAGISYKYVSNDSTRVEEAVGLDLFMMLPYNIDLTAMTTRNLVSGDFGEHLIEARLQQFGINFRPFIQSFRYEDYFSTTANSANPFRYLAGTGEKLNIFGTDATKVGEDGLEYAGKFKFYDYSNTSATSLYISGLTTWHGEDLTQAGGELGLMDGDRPQDDYYICRLFAYWDQMPGGLWPEFVSGDLVFVDYKEAIQGEDTSLFISVGGGYRLLADALEIKLSGDYSSDPFYDSDLRGTLTITYKYRQGQE